MDSPGDCVVSSAETFGRLEGWQKKAFQTIHLLKDLFFFFLRKENKDFINLADVISDCSSIGNYA